MSRLTRSSFASITARNILQLNASVSSHIYWVLDDESPRRGCCYAHRHHAERFAVVVLIIDA